MLTIVTETVDAHRLQKMRDRLQKMRGLLAFEKLATWRRINDFDRVADGEENWFHGHRSLSPTPQELCASLKFELQKLKNEISMPSETTKTRPWQKTMDFVDGLIGQLPDEELAVIKRYVEKRSREAAQAQVTVTPVDNVQHGSPWPPNPDMPSDVCFRLESREGKMGPELKELESPSAGTGLEKPGQQCPPNEGTWDQGRTTADGFSTAGVGSNQEGNIVSSTTKIVDTRTSTKSTRTTADITFLQLGHKPRDKEKGSEENKQFDPGGKREEAPFRNAAVTLPPLSVESVGPWEARCLCFVFLSVCVIFLSSLFSKLLFFPGDHFSAN